ncbi:hypothetical protein SBRCBS47491_000225 [Sporothrix bragantina]|uniref:Cellobiose dehydrogenase-like cytochrome domain-containing protein n=1 Tax=Sporothrix bragantina TaxID=671064 RepID=A0ABP0ANI1_9PEZI
MFVGTQAVTTYCPSGAKNVCYGIGVPETTASKGSGNIYFSITAPTSYQWVALGTGSMMAGSNMFIMYQDGKGNVTLSPRLGTFHVAPSQDTSSTAAKLTLLAGSGVSGSTMTANVMCSNCESWGSSGKLSVTSTNAPWIGAWKAGSSLATTNKNAALTVHDNTAQYQLDMTKATISSDSNPFVSSGSSSSGSGSGSGTGTGSGSGSGSDSGGTGSGNGSNSGDNSGGGVTVVSASSPSTAILTAHAVILALVMVVLYPLGSALMPLLGKWLVHGIWQGLAYLLMWAGFALGVVAAQQRGLLYANQGRTHTILGTVVVAAMAFQPFLGLMHHRHFVRYQGRGFVSHWHIWWGRLLMVLGIINGGLGLQLSMASKSVIIGYSVASAVLFLAYVAAKVIGSCVMTPARSKKNLDRGMNVSGNGQVYDDGNRGGNRHRGPAPDMAYSREGNYNGGSSVSPSLPPTRAQRPTAATLPEDSERNRNRMRREERRYA